MDVRFYNLVHSYFPVTSNISIGVSRVWGREDSIDEILLLNWINDRGLGPRWHGIAVPDVAPSRRGYTRRG
jgi:hypothetical protein